MARRKRRLFWQLFPAYVLIAAGVFLALVYFGRGALREFHQEQVAIDLEARTRLFADRIEPLLAENDPAPIDALAKTLGKATATRLTVILPSGKVVADTDEDPARMDDHGTRPEIVAAWDHRGPRQSVRHSDTIGEDLMYVALPLYRGDERLAVVRAATSLATIRDALQTLERLIGLGTVLAVVLIAAASWLIVRRSTRPLETMTAGSQRLAQGELDHRLPIQGSREIAVLAEGMNEMAAQLRERFQTISRQRDQLDAMLTSMAEGVLAMDSQGAILELNQAGAAMLGLDPAEVRGRLVHEVLRKADLLRFFEETLASGEALAEGIVIHGEQDRHLNARGAPLHDARRQTVGTLIVLHDVTRLRELEQSQDDREE